MLKKILLIVVLSLPAAAFLLRPGFYEPQDLHHIADIYEMVRAIGSHQLVPRLGPDYIFGYGYPLFNFYYPMPFYLGALFFGITHVLTISLKLVFITCIFSSVIFMFFLLREFVDDLSSIAGTILFLYTPYRSVQIYVRGAIGEALSLALIPFFIWSIVKVIKKPKLFYVLVMGVVGAIFILSHNYFWFLSLPYIFTFVLVFYRKFNLRLCLILLAGWTISVGLSFYWWFPALIEQKLVSATTPFPLFDHFPFIKQLIVPFWGYGASVWGPNDGLSFQIGVVNWIVFLLLIIILIIKRKFFLKKQTFWIGIWVVVGMFVTIFMMNVRSYPIWKLMPFYNFVQFPWRLLTFTTLLSSVGGALFVSFFKGLRKIIACFLVIVFSIGLTLNYFRPSHVVYTTDDYYLHRMFANRSIEGKTSGVSSTYLQYSEDYLQLTPYMKTKPTTLPKEKIYSIDASVLNITQLSSVSWSADVVAKKTSNVFFYAMYFPGWKATVDGIDTKTFPGPSGIVSISVAEGIHKVTFGWYETPFRTFADIVSLMTFVICLLGFALIIYGEKRKRK